MRKRQKKNKILRLILVLGIILIILLSIIYIIVNNKGEAKKEPEKTMYTAEDLKNQAVNKVKDMNERARIQYYIGQYIKNIEQRNYKYSYDVLNSEFKQTYFPDLMDYVEYVEKNFGNKSIALEYTNFERIGEYYVVWVNVIDPQHDDPLAEDKDEQTFVVKENDLADFELSFSVKGADEE